MPNQSGPDQPGLPSSRQLPGRPSLNQLQKQAKELLRDLRVHQPGAIERLHAAVSHGGPQTSAAEAVLADAQFTIAREYGFATWAELKRHVLAGPSSHAVERFRELARHLIRASEGDTGARQALERVYPGQFFHPAQPFVLSEFHGRLQQQLAFAPEPLRGFALPLTEEQAQFIIARRSGFADWDELTAPIPTSRTAAAAGARSLHGRFYQIDFDASSIDLGAIVSDLEWHEVFDVIRTYGITTIRSNGRMTDAALAELSKIDHITSIDLDGALQVTDDGLLTLGRLSELEELVLGNPRCGITDRGLAVLRHLPQLRRFQASWLQQVSDAGVAQLENCHHLRDVNLMGTPTGDEALRALRGKTNLARLHTGRLTTDAGLRHLAKFPAFCSWPEQAPLDYGLMRADCGPTYLLLDGPFTDAGLASLRELETLYGLGFFWHAHEFTANGIRALAGLPRLGYIGCQDARCDDAAMEALASLPCLRMLMAQGAVATDAGFTALSRSRTLEAVWGRDWAHFTGRGFRAFAQMEALRGLAVECSRVDADSLALLPAFPSLRSFVPMGFSDDGFAAIGQCRQLEQLWCMYCRNTGDRATEAIAGLDRLRLYYAGMTQITDRSLELLACHSNLESLEFWRCVHLTGAGLAPLRELPRLKEITVGGSPGVTPRDLAGFAPGVKVRHFS